MKKVEVANADDLTPPVGPSDHVRGVSPAAFTLVQFGDYECPFTANSHWQIELLLKNFAGRMRFVWRHFPLKKHLFALRAAEAVEAAGVQGKFWEMHSALLRHEHALGWESLREAAQALRLDVARFDQEVLDHVHRPKIHQHLDGAMRSGVTGTPTFFVNGSYYDGPDNYDDFAALIQKGSGAAPPSSKPAHA